MTVLEEQIADLPGKVKVMAYRCPGASTKNAHFVIVTGNDFVPIPSEMMVELCAKVGNYLGFPKMEIDSTLASSQFNGVISTQNNVPSSQSPLGTLKTVEIE